MKLSSFSLSSLILFFYAATATAEFQVCKIFVGSSTVENSQTVMNQLIQSHFTVLNIQGYTTYDAQGTWRAADNQQFQTEPTTVIEIVAQNPDIPHIHLLVLELETQLKQRDVLYYCQDVKSTSLLPMPLPQ
jgi:hypothetical protein